MAHDADLKSDYHDISEVHDAGWDLFNDQAQLDLDYYFRAQHTAEEVSKAQIQDRVLHTMDKTQRQIALLEGYEIKNRHILKVGPMGQPDEREDIVCEQHTGVLMSLMALNGGYTELSHSFKWGSLIQGSNLLEVWRDRDNMLQFSRLGWNQFTLDPGLTKGDLSDCTDIRTGQWISKDKAKTLVPSRASEIEKIKPAFLSNRWKHLGNPYLNNKAGKRLFEQWWRRTTKFVPTVISRITGEERSLQEVANDEPFFGDERLARRTMKEAFHPNIGPLFSIFQKPHSQIRLTVFIDDEFIWDGVNPLKLDDYNFVWLKGDWCHESPRSELKLQSFMRGLRDPQNARNRRINQIMDIAESHIQSGRIVRSKWLLNPEDAHKSGQGIALHTNESMPDEARLTDVFQAFGAPDTPAGLFTALEVADRSETEAMGLNDEIFGSDDKDIPGILHKYRTGQALTGQAGVFQSFWESKRRLGQILVQLVQLNFTKRQIVELINQEPVPGFYKKDAIKNDCTPMEGLDTDSQQQAFYMELKNLRLQFPDEAHLIPLSEVVKYSPTAFKSSLRAIIKRGEERMQQAQQAAQQQTQRQEALQDALTASELAQSEERRAQAVENQTSAALDRVNTRAKIQELTDKPIRDRAKMLLEASKLQSINRIADEKLELEKRKLAKT